ncbi:hypothetical protein ACTHGU_01140 [Chitinophagaceae bacterium MMS25-I14]
MKADVYSHAELIGTAELEIGDESMGCIFGAFIPTDVYYKKIQPIVWEFWKTNDNKYAKWSALRFNIQLENGYFLYAAGGLIIDDIPEFLQEPKRIDISGLDRNVIDDFFLEKKTGPFIERPWCTINIKQKIAFEDELNKESGISHSEKKSYSFFSRPKKSGHTLEDFDLSALCHDQRNDDVLFVTRKTGFDKQFAVIHLTWKGQKESNGFPSVTFFNDFEDFRNSKMYPDSADYEH